VVCEYVGRPIAWHCLELCWTLWLRGSLWCPTEGGCLLWLRTCARLDLLIEARRDLCDKHTARGPQARTAPNRDGRGQMWQGRAQSRVQMWQGRAQSRCRCGGRCTPGGEPGARGEDTWLRGDLLPEDSVPMAATRGAALDVARAFGA
jgi:hypothetical protein